MASERIAELEAELSQLRIKPAGDIMLSRNVKPQDAVKVLISGLGKAKAKRIAKLILED